MNSNGVVIELLERYCLWMEFDVFINGHFCNNHASCYTEKNIHHLCSIYFNAFQMGWDGG